MNLELGSVVTAKSSGLGSTIGVDVSVAMLRTARGKEGRCQAD